jgi:hypothetical protein
MREKFAASRTGCDAKWKEHRKTNWKPKNRFPWCSKAEIFYHWSKMYFSGVVKTQLKIFKHFYFVWYFRSMISWRFGKNLATSCAPQGQRHPPFRHKYQVSFNVQRQQRIRDEVSFPCSMYTLLEIIFTFKSVLCHRKTKFFTMHCFFVLFHFSKSKKFCLRYFRFQPLLLTVQEITYSEKCTDLYWAFQTEGWYLQAPCTHALIESNI